MIVTPDMAQRWLLRQTEHHHEGQHQQIERYALGMRSGYWICNGRDPVKFDDRGRLVDGRCRIAAVAVSGIPVSLHVIGWHFGPSAHNDDIIT